VPSAHRRRPVAWLTAALACLIPAVPSLAGPDAPAAGSYRVLTGVVRLAGADGALWILGVSASASDVAAADDHSVYVSLSHCPGFDARCSHVGAWRIGVGASSIQVASDLSTASLKTTISGFPITMTLRSTGPANPTLPAYPEYAVRSNDATPSAVVRLSQLNSARGTVTFAGTSCPVPTGYIGEDTGVDTTGHDEPAYGSYAEAPVPAGLNAELTHGPYGRPYCLGPNAVPKAGQRITVPAGSYVGRLTVPAGANVDVNASLINIDDSHSKAVAAFVVKAAGKSLLSWQQTVVRVPPWDELLGEPYRGMFYRGRFLAPGTYDFALVSTNGVTAHLFATKHLTVTSLHRDNRWQVSRQTVEMSPQLPQSTATITRSFTKTTKTYGLKVDSYTVWTNNVPPLDAYDLKSCFRPRGQACNEDQTYSSQAWGPDVGLSEGEPSWGESGELCFGCWDTIPNGPAEAYMELTNYGGKGTLDMVTMTGPLG